MEREDDPCTVPRDGDDPQIWSFQIATGPFSLLIGQPLDPNCLPPTYLSLQLLNRIRQVDKASQFEGYVQYQQGGLLCQDQRVLQNQSGVIMEVIRQVAAVLMKGQGLVGLSLPIRLFQPRSTLQRMLDRWALMSFYFQGILNFDPLTRLKKVIAMAVAGLAVAPSQQKPFNPLLGETLQAYWPDGTQAYCQHTCHHPPITNFHVIGNGFTMTGHLELTGKFKKNSLIGGILGTVNVNFADGQKISYSYPEFRAGGMLMGARTVNWQGTMVFNDYSNQTEAVISFGPVRKKSMFRRAIGKLDDFKGEIKVGGNKVGEIVGSWLKNLVIDEEEIWNIDIHRPVFHQFPVNPLPSDWRYREDLVYLTRGNKEAAQRWKHKIENRQRQDRKLKGLKY